MSEPESASVDTRRRRLLYRATHRGTYENDILLGGFVQRHIAALHDSELAALEALLDIPENELGDWLTGRMAIPVEADTPMLRRVRDEAGESSGVRTALLGGVRGVQEDVDGRATPGHDGTPGAGRDGTSGAGRDGTPGTERDGSADTGRDGSADTGRDGKAAEPGR
jgi:antitoxin CptB